MCTMKKTRATYRINQNRKYEDTKIERTVEAWINEMGLLYQKQYEITCIDEGKRWTFKIDFAISPTGPPPKSSIMIEVLGHYHFTLRQEHKTRWRSELIAKDGYSVILIEDSSLNIAEAKGELEKAINQIKAGEIRRIQ